MDQMGEKAASSGSGRRRRRSRAKAKVPPMGLVGFVRTALFGRGLAAIMVLIAAVYSWQAWLGIEQAGQRLGPVVLGMDASQVRAALGQPTRTSSTATDLTIEQDGRSFSVRFDGPELRAAELTCWESGVTALACPTLLGIKIGDEQATVLRELGAGQQGQEGNRESLAYPQTGAYFALERGRVVQVSVKSHVAQPKPWRMLLSRLIP